VTTTGSPVAVPLSRAPSPYPAATDVAGPPAPTPPAAAVLALGSAAPAARIDQTDVFDGFYAQLYRDVPDARRLFVEATRVRRRFFTWDPRVDLAAGFPALGARVDAWERETLALGRRSLAAVLDGVDPARVGTFIMVSTTGYACPGPQAALAQQLGLRPETRRTFIGHMGCYAALTGLRTALDAIAARPGELVLLCCVELTSLHVRGEASAEQAIVHGLFGDACAAMLLGAAAGSVTPATAGPATATAPVPGAPAVLSTLARTFPGTAEAMTIRVREDGFRLRLSPEIPSMLAATTPAFLTDLLAPRGLDAADVRHWAIHPGGPRIVDKVGDALGLSAEQRAASLGVLADYGNCSSATVLLVLERVLRESRPAPGEYGVMIAFGPGLTTEAALLRF